MRWPTASIAPSSSAYDSILRGVSSGETRSSFRLVEPALTTRTSRAVNLQLMEPDVPGIVSLVAHFVAGAAKSLYRAAQPVPLFRYPPERIPL